MANSDPPTDPHNKKLGAPGPDPDATQDAASDSDTTDDDGSDDDTDDDAATNGDTPPEPPPPESDAGPMEPHNS